MSWQLKRYQLAVLLPMIIFYNVIVKKSWRSSSWWYFSIQGGYSRIGIEGIILRIHWMNILFLHSVQSSLSKSTWGKILWYYQHSSVPKILADESFKNFGVFKFHTMSQTHPQLAGTIREKLNLVNNLMKCHEKRKKSWCKSPKWNRSPNGPDTQCNNGDQLKYSFFTLWKQPG